MEEHEKAIYAQMDSFHCVRERRVRGKEKRTHLYQINIYVFEWPQSTTPDDRQQMIESSRHIRYWSTWARRTKSRAVIWRKQWIWMKIADYTSLISWQIRKFSVHSNYHYLFFSKCIMYRRHRHRRRSSSVQQHKTLSEIVYIVTVLTRFRFRGRRARSAKTNFISTCQMCHLVYVLVFTNLSIDSMRSCMYRIYTLT